MLEAMTGSAKVIPAPPKGQQEWSSPGTYQWICPVGVTSVSFVAVAGGQDGSTSGVTARGGNGGGLRYRNNVTVVPGNAYSIVVGGRSPSGGNSSAFGTTVGLGASSSGIAALGGPGGNGEIGSYRLAAGGKGGTYDGSNPGANYLTQSVGPNLLGNSNSGALGSGGYASVDGNGNVSTALGRNGGVRIIWGANRTFPDKAT